MTTTTNYSIVTRVIPFKTVAMTAWGAIQLIGSIFGFQDPKIELLYHIEPYCGAIFPLGLYIGQRYMIRASNKSGTLLHGHWFFSNFGDQRPLFRRVSRGSKLLGFAKHRRVRDHRAPFKARPAASGQRCSMLRYTFIVPGKDREVKTSKTPTKIMRHHFFYLNLRIAIGFWFVHFLQPCSQKPGLVQGWTVSFNWGRLNLGTERYLAAHLSF